jgi:hypothetical protein
MRNETGRALAILLVLVTAIAVAEGVMLIKMEGRLSRVEEGRLPGASSGDATPLALGDEMWELREKQEGTEEKVQVLSKTVTALKRDLDRGLAKANRASPGAGRPVERGGGVDADAVERTVARMLEEKLKDQPQHEGGEWKPTLEQFKEKLDLTEDQVAKSERIFDDAKHEAFELLTLKRDDGTGKIDDLVGAMKSADPEAEMKKVFMGLFTEKIPGREETYIAEILRIKVRAQTALGGVLTSEQSKTLSRMNIDHLGVHTSYDPFAEYIQESMR